jgi:hypothetical protein
MGGNQQKGEFMVAGALTGNLIQVKWRADICLYRLSQ